MAAMGNPAVAMMARQLIDGLSQRGAGPSQQGGPGGGAPDMAMQALSGRLNELQGADPGLILRKLTQMKQDIVELIPHVAFSLPGVSKHITNLWKNIEGAIKECEQALNTEQSVANLPVGMNAAQPAQQPTAGGGGAPLPGGSPWLGGMGR